MDVVNLSDGAGKAVIRAAGVLRQGGVILYPTDTLYGLGADALSDEAVAKIHAIKGRDPRMPISCTVADLAMAGEYVEINDAARKLAEKFLPGPLTLVLRKKPGINTGIARGMDTIGIRIPNNEFCLELARTYGRPFTTTSANLVGEPTLATVQEILVQLGKNADGIDVCIDAGLLPMSIASTVVNLVSGHPSILRAGAIPKEDIVSM